MLKKTLLTAAAVLLAAGLISIGCKTAPTGRPAPAGGEPTGELHVLHATPQGQLGGPREAEQIVIVFDQTMAPLEPLPIEEAGALLRFEPAVAGKYRWMGTRALTFTPRERFPFGTEVKVTIPAGLRSLDGHALKSDYSWTFQTARPYLVQSVPGAGNTQVRLDASVVLVFNQPVDPAAAESFISLAGACPGKPDHAPGAGLLRPSAEKLKEAGLQAKPETVLQLEPREILKPDYAYTVELKSGLPGREGPLGLEKQAVIRFETYKTFRFTGLNVTEPLAPGEQLVISFTNNVRYKDILPKISFEPKVEIPDSYESWENADTSIWLSLPFAPETSYTVRIAGDLKDEFGNTLGQPAEARFQTGPYPPSVRMTTGQGVLEAYLDKVVPISAINAGKVRIMAAALSRDEIIPLANNDRSMRSDEPFQPRPAFYAMDETRALQLPRNKRQFLPVSLNDLLPGGYGLVFLQLDTFSEETWGRYPKAMLQVTDLAVTGKFSPENNVIWVTELRTGLPAADAEVEIRDDANMVRWRGRTDASGRAQTPGWRPLGIKLKSEWSKPVQWVFVSRGRDTAFTSSDWGTGIEPYRFNIDYDWSPEPPLVRGYVYTERGIYRAGETVHIKGIVRRNEKGRWVLPKSKTVELTVDDSVQKRVFKGPAAVDAFGSFSFDLETKAGAALGYYTVSAKLAPEKPGENPEACSGSFRVEAFRPAEFEVHLRAQKDAFVFGEPYQAEVRGSYLYGGMMSGQKVGWTLRLNAAGFDPPGHKGFLFGNEIDDYEEGRYSETSRLLASGATTLNLEGKLAVSVPLVPEKEKSSVRAVLEANVQSPSRRSISNRIDTIVHRGEYYIGLKPRSAFIKKGEAVAAEVISVRPDGAAAPDKKLAIRLLRREWKSARRAVAGGGFEWVSEKTDAEIGVREIKTGREAAAVSFQPEKSGLYVLAAEGQDGRRNLVSTSTYIYVSGGDYVPWERRDDDSLELVADADSYKPGDKARVLIKSPYEKAKALITVEREHVLDSRVLDIQGSAVPIEIPITADYLPNVFVSVLLVQGRTAGAAVSATEDVGKPSFKIGYVPLRVDAGAKRLAVTVAPDKEAFKPRDKVRVKLAVKDAAGAGAPAQLSVAVVDVGVLNLIGYRTPDPFGWFYGEKSLSVETSDSRIHVVGQRHYGEKGENSGGGGGPEEAKSLGLSEVELRGDFRTTAFWNPALLTDERGEAVFEFTLPDNLTSFRIMAVAQTADSKFGGQEATIKVSKPLLLLASSPRFVRLGDEFQAGALVNNYSGRKGSVVLALESEGLVLKDKPEVTFELEANGSREVLFAFGAEKAGTARLALRAKMGPDSDGLEYRLPVQVPRGTETVASFDQTNEAKEEKVSIPDTIYLEDSRIEVTAAASALSGLQGALAYLRDYPYLCLEQRISGLLPYLVAPQLIREFKLSPMEPKEIDGLVRRTLQEIYACQKDSGGFGLWTDTARESPYVTAFAVFALIKAKESGYEVNEDRLSQAAAFLRRFATTAAGDSPYPYRENAWKTVQAFALYDLAVLGRFDAAAADVLFRDRHQLAIFGRAMLYKAMARARVSAQAQDTLLQEMLNLIKTEASQSHFEEDDLMDLGWIYSTNARTTACVLQAMVETGRPHPLLPNIVRWLVAQRRAGRWHTTQENFFVFYALNEFYRTYESVRPDFRAEISFAGSSILQENFRSAQQTARAEKSLAGIKPGKDLALRVGKTGPGTLHYGVRLTYAQKQPLQARDEGFAVYKTITALDGKPLASIKAGQTVMVTLQILVPKESLFVVVDDPLPAGFEAINPAFETESQEQQTVLAEAARAEYEWGWWTGFHHIEMHDNRVLLFADSLTAGVHTHRYLARALTPGKFILPGSKAEQMYAPETFGRSAERSVQILK